ncbi:T9SS type A sorting domain-containing protein [Pontibacter harenae]|uniref:T9SS type A sorting domain-containing protein n=1 Tax=Pontibacter harenae TaxID=2894083 RepID=UPI001E4D7AFB|nr:T9SS type A sorting domain-containing protein [Pontibacter harenae]MCC9166809.1 T9SS type A sorting domain-containing protein [Pontibacter harenae]
MVIITFAPIADQMYPVAPFELKASATSGLAMKYQVIGGPARVSGNVLTVTGPGLVTVKAMQWGNGRWATAEPVEQSFNVVGTAVSAATAAAPVASEGVKLQAAESITAYPNPFAETVTLEFVAKESGKMKLEVFSLQGELVETLYQGEAEAGKTYSFKFDGGSHATGVYLCRLTTANGVLYKRVVLVR